MAAVLFLRNNLRSHVLESAAIGKGDLRLSVLEDLAETEVCQHQVAWGVQEDVLQLYVAVDDASLWNK